MNPRTRRKGAWALLVASVVIGLPCSWWLPSADIDPVWYGRVLLLISFLAITISAVDVVATTDVRAENGAAPSAGPPPRPGEGGR